MVLLRTPAGPRGPRLRAAASGYSDPNHVFRCRMGDFQLVDILVLDPDLGVSPSNSTVAVRGEIVDVVQSEFCFKTLAVIADEAEVR